MHRNDLIPHLLVHLEEGLVPKDTSIGDKDMNGTKGIYGSLDDCVPIFRRTRNRYSLAAS
jgi:hypothetical protein